MISLNYQKKGKIYTPRTKKTLTPKLKAMQKKAECNRASDWSFKTIWSNG